LPPDDRTVGLPRDDAVDPELGRRFDRVLVPTVLGEGLHERQAKGGGRLVRPGDHPQPDDLTGDVVGHRVHTPTPAVGDEDLLADGDPDDGGGVVGLRTGEVDGVVRAEPVEGTRVDEEERRGHGGPSAPEGVPQPADEPGVDVVELAVGGLLLPDPGEVAQHLLLLAVEASRGPHVGVDDQVAPTAGAQVGHAEPGQDDRVARLGAPLDGDLLLAVEGREAHLHPERRRGHRHRHGRVEVVTAPGEGLVLPDVQLDVEVAGRPAAGADLPFAGEVDPGAGVDAGGDLDLHRAAGTHPTLARALVAGAGDDLAEALAGRARTARHDLAEEGALDLLDLAPSGTGVAGAPSGARLRPVTGARGADRSGVDRQLLLAAEDGRRQVDLETDQAVLPARGAGARSTAAPGGAGTEELLHDVAEAEAGTEALVGSAVGVAAHVVLATFRLVGEHVVGLGDPFEALFGVLARVDVGVQGPGEPAVGPLDVLGAGIAADAEILVVVVHA